MGNGFYILNQIHNWTKIKHATSNKMSSIEPNGRAVQNKICSLTEVYIVKYVVHPNHVE